MTPELTVSPLELELVITALRIPEETAGRYSELAPLNFQCHPIPFFGSLDRASVITLGLNPSTHEFTSARNWPLQITAEQLASRLVNYWTPNSPGSHPWFKPWSTVLGELGTSYFEGAAHLDLSPRATNSRKNRLRSLFVDMLQIDSAIWIEALRRAPNCRLVLAAGSATNRDYINQFISKMLRLTGVRLEAPWRPAGGEGQTVFQTICLPGGRKIPFFFCSTGPTIRKGSVLVDACRERINELKQYYRTPTANGHFNRSGL